jgi:hypothetical protein
LDNDCGVENTQIITDPTAVVDVADDGYNSDYSDASGNLSIKTDLEVHVIDDAVPEINDVADSISMKTESPEIVDNSELELRCKELELKVLMFEGMFADIRRELDAGMGENSTLISSLSSELSTCADRVELKRLKRDFDQFSKRLKRVAKSEDSISAEVLDAAKVPPDVLEITYGKTLNDLYSAMTAIFGEDESSDIVENIRDQVRQFSAGVDFFLFDEGAFRIRGLSSAINSKLVSVKQIHGTYVELFKLLNQYVPNYDSQDFRSFVETGSREYAVEKIVVHEKIINDIISDQNNAVAELSNLTENMQFMAELQNNQLDDSAAIQESVAGISEQIKGITKAVNLHTKALKKINENFRSLHSNPDPDHVIQSSDSNVELLALETSVQSKADRDEVLAISTALNVFRDEMGTTLESMHQQMQDSLSQVGLIDNIQNEVFRLRDELVNELNNSIQSPMIEDEALPILSSNKDQELLILEEVCKLGSATLKQLGQQVSSDIVSYDDLSLIVADMEQKNRLISSKKGRYVYYSIA